MVSVFDQRVRSVEDNAHILAVGKPFEESAQLRSSRFKIVILDRDKVKTTKMLLAKERGLQKSEQYDCLCHDRRRVCHALHTLRQTTAAT